jgi:hypothetical protein
LCGSIATLLELEGVEGNGFQKKLYFNNDHDAYAVVHVSDNAGIL